MKGYKYEGMNNWESYNFEELEKQMSPSRWNPIKTPEEVINDHVNVITELSNNGQSKLNHQLNIKYGIGEFETYDLYGTDLGDNSPICIFIHGGYWAFGKKDFNAFFVESTYKWGYKTAIVDYTIAPTGNIASMEGEVAHAILHVLNSHPQSRVVLCGHSAGAQLLANTVLHNDRIDIGIERISGLVLASGIFDLRPLVPTYVNDPLKMDVAEAIKRSPILNDRFSEKLSPTTKVLIVAGEFDSPEFRFQSFAYSQKFQTTFDTELHFVNSDDHFTIVENWSDESSKSGKILKRFFKKLQ